MIRLLVSTLIVAPILVAAYFLSHASSSPFIFLGLLAFTCLLAPAAAILTAATLPTRHALASALILAVAIALLLAVSRQLPLATLPSVGFLLLTCTASWSLFTSLLARCGRTVAPVIALTLFTVLFAGPVTLVPFAHLASKHSHELYDRVLTFISYATPVLPVLSAVKNTFPEAAHWSEWKILYTQLSDITQEIGLRASPLHAILIYLALSVFLLIPLELLPARRHRTGSEKNPTA